MFCTKCQNDIVDCTCPDINERLESLRENSVVSIAVEQNIKAREKKQSSEVGSCLKK